MATKQKTENYTAEQTAAIRATYVAAVEAGAGYDALKGTVAELAEKFGKSVQSIRAKLTREGVYVAKEYTNKAGEKPVKKDSHADAIGKVLGLSEPDTESLTKANRKALASIFSALANSVPVEAETPEELAGKAENLATIAACAGLSAEEVKSLSRVRNVVLAKIAATLADPAD